MAKYVFHKLATEATLSILNKFEKKISGKGVIVKRGAGGVRARKGFNLFISNEDMVDIIKIVELLENSCLLIDMLLKQ